MANCSFFGGFRRGLARLLVLAPVLISLVVTLPGLAQAKMVADTLVIYAVVDSLNGATAVEGVILYNPTPHNITNLSNYLIQSSAENDASGVILFGATDTIAPFGYLFVADGQATDTLADGTTPDALTDPANDSYAIYEPDGSRLDLFGNGTAGDGEGTLSSAMAASNDARIRRPSLNLYTHNIRPGGGGGGMIDKGDNSLDFDDDTSYTGIQRWPNRRQGTTDRMVFVCTAPVNVRAGEAFSFSCTAAVNFGERTGAQWHAKTYADSVVKVYDGTRAWGDITVSGAASLSGLAGDSTFDSGVLNNYSLFITGATGNVTITIQDAFCTGHVIVNVRPSAFAADGDSSEWKGTPSSTAHDTAISEGEFIYTGVAGDERTDQNTWTDANYDLTQVRFTGDTNYLYVLAVMQDIDDSRAPHVGFNIDVDQDPADGSLNWVMADDNGVCSMAYQFGETNVSLHVSERSNFMQPDIEMFSEDYSAWHHPSRTGERDSISISTTNNVIEAALWWKDVIGPGASLPAQVSFTLATASNSTNYDSSGAATHDVFEIDAHDNMRPKVGTSCAACPASWDWDLENQSYDSFVTIAFNKDGRVNSIPGTPSLFSPADANVYDSTTTSVTLEWRLNDADTPGAKDSYIQVTVGSSVGGADILDSKLYGLDLDVVLNVRAGTYYWRIRHSDDFNTSAFTSSRSFSVNAAPDTLDIVTPDTGGFAAPWNLHETTVASIVITGRSSGDSSLDLSGSPDTIQIRVNNSIREWIYHKDTGFWRDTLTLTEKPFGETVAISLFQYGGGQLNDTERYLTTDTIVFVLDNTKPRMTKRSDTYLQDGDAVGATDQNVFFYVVDTGSAFDGVGSCTLYWHVDSGANTNSVGGGMSDDGKGTWTITGTIPLSSVNPKVDTSIGFWIGCFDDLNNTMDSTSLSPAYLAANPGTFTIDVPGVRDVVISEIMGAPDTGEYIELFNTTKNAISIANWTLYDAGTSGRSFVATFPSGTSIPAQGYFLVYSSSQDYAQFADLANHDSYLVSTWDQDDINNVTLGETLSLRSSDGIEIDSTGDLADSPVKCDWSTAGVTNQTDTTFFPSFERKMTWSAGRLVAGYGPSLAEWDTNRGHHGYGARRGGSPGHINSVNTPYVDTISPATVVQASGRGRWDITITNGNTDFTSNGRIVAQAPPNWTAPQGSSSSPGYTTVFSQDNGCAGASLTFSNGSAIATFSAFPANARLTIRYGDASANRDGLAQAQSSPGWTQFQLFFDTDGTQYEQVGDSNVYNFGNKGDSMVVVWLDTYFVDTAPASNPQTFTKSSYEFTWTVSDSLSRPVYAAHVTADTDGPTYSGAQDTGFPHLTEYAGFDGFYQPTGSTFRNVTGWTNASGKFTFTITVSDTIGANRVLIRDTDFTPAANAHQFTDSARQPVPVLSEIGWDGTSDEFIEIYNPTDSDYGLANFKILSGDNRNNAALDVDASDFNAIRSVPPFSYAVFLRATGFQDTGTAISRVVSGISIADGASGAGVADTVFVHSRTGDTIEYGGTKSDGEFFNDKNSDGAPDSGAFSSLERVYHNRSAIDTSAWAESDSRVGYPSGSGLGSPGRPNSRSLFATVIDGLDTRMSRTLNSNTAFDSARVTMIMKIGSGDTQPHQAFSGRATIDEGAYHYGSAADSSFFVNVPDSTNQQGTAAIRVSANSNNVSGTVVLRIIQPRGVTDSARFVFDRGESLAYSFQSSETGVFDTSPENAMVVFVAYYDTFSGMDSSIMPQIRWKIGSSGSYSTLANMKLFGGDSYLARIDISSSTYAIGSRDTIYWQVVWRDKAGNWDTSPDNNTRSSEFIDNTRARDTLVSPTFADTLSGGSQLIDLRIYDQANNYCTITVKYDTYGSGLWTNATLESGSDTKTNLTATPAGMTLKLRWNTPLDLVDTTINSVRLRIEVFDGFDTHTDTSDIFGVANRVPDTSIILTPNVASYENTTTVRISWRYKGKFSTDTQSAWLIQVDTGPNPDWADMVDSQSGSGIRNDTRTKALPGGGRYHVRVLTWNTSGAGSYSEDTWFWVPRRVMDGHTVDWNDTSAPNDTNSGSVWGGEFIWFDAVGDRRVDPANLNDFDLTEFRVTSDSYFYFFMFRMSAMSATSEPLFSIALDSNRSAIDTSLNWLGDDSETGGSTELAQGAQQYSEVNIDYALAGGDSPIWMYKDTGASWVRENAWAYEYIHGTNKVAELAIPKESIRPLAGLDTIRITVGIADNNSGDPGSVDRTTDYPTTDFLDNIFPGNVGADSADAWPSDLSDGDMDFYLDIFFRDTGDVRPNSRPTGAMTAQTPNDGSETSIGSFTFRWLPAADADPEDTVTYWFRLDDDSNFRSPNKQVYLVWGGETVTAAPGDSSFASNTTYFWQVRARDNHGQYGAWSDTFEFTASAVSDTPIIFAPTVNEFQNTTTVRIAWRFKSPFGGDTQTAWEIQVDTGPGPDWAQLVDSQSRSGIRNDTRTIPLQGGNRYHVRMRAWNANGAGGYSDDTWFWVPKRVMDGHTNDWYDTAPTETDAGYVSGGEFIWMDRIGDRRSEPGTPGDFDMTEFRVTSDSYFYFFMWRMSNMSATAEPLFTIAIDSDRKSNDTSLDWASGDESLGANSTAHGNGPPQWSEINVDYGLVTGDSPIWWFTDTGGSWVRENTLSYEYIHAGNKVAELAIPREALKPIGGGDTLRLTVGIAGNSQTSPNAGDQTDDYATTDHLDNIFPGAGRGALGEDLSDGDMDFYVDVFFKDTGDVRPNGSPGVTGVTAVNPPNGTDTGRGPFTIRWTSATDPDSTDTVTYRLRVSRNTTFSSIDSEVVLIRGGETAQVTGLTDSTTYYWQVRARDNHGSYSVWSDTFQFNYRFPPGSIDGDTSDWYGTPSTTAHDTAISQGEWIYTGENDDQRVDTSDIDEVDVNQVRFKGTTDSLLLMVRFKNIATTDSVHVALGVDIDMDGGDAALTWLADQDGDPGMSYATADMRTETNVAIHNTTNGVTRIEMYAQDGFGGTWHAPRAGRDDAAYISTVHDVLEAAINWKDLSITLPKRVRFTMGIYYNNVTYNDSGDATQDNYNNDCRDAVTPLPSPAATESWFRDLSDNDFDSSFIINFNKTGKANHYAETPVTQTADSFVFGETESPNVILSWALNDFDSGDAKDSNLHVQIRNDWTLSLVVDSNSYGLDTYKTFIMPQKPAWYSWRVRHADDFSTSAYSAYRHFKINTPPQIQITGVVAGDTMGLRKAINYYVVDSTTVYDTVTRFDYSPDSGTNWYAAYQQTGNTENISVDLTGETYSVTWAVSRNLFDSSIANARVQIRMAVTDGVDTAWDTVTDLNVNTLLDTGSVTVFVSDRGDSTSPFAGDTDGAIHDIQRAINFLDPNNGADTVVIFQRLAADSWRLTVAINPDSGMTLMGFREWNRIVNGQNTDTGGPVDTYAKIANSANTSVIYVANVDQVKVVGLILEGDSGSGASKNGMYLDNSSNDSISLVHVYRMNTALRLSAAETNLIAANVIGRNLNQGVRLVSSSQNNTIRGNQISTNDSEGISAEGGSINNTIRDNTLRKGAAGISLAANSNVVTANSILEMRTFGVQVDGGLHNRILHNWITQSATYGVSMVNGAQGNYASQNDIDSSFLAGVFFSSVGTNHTDTFDANNITRGDTGALNAEGTAFDIRYNWWGTPSEDGVGDTAVNTGGSTLTFQAFSVFGVDTTAGADTLSPNSTTMKTDSTVSATSATIKWDTVTADRDGTALNGFEGFYVFRWTAATPLWFDTALIDTVLLGGGRDTQYVDTPDQLTTYYYRVAAFDSHYANGQLYINVSGLSDTLVVSTPSANTAPRDTIILPTTGDTFASGETYSATMGIKFVILDPDSNFCTVAVQFSKDSGQTWSNATLTGTSVIGSLYAPTFGDTKTIAWMTKSDIPDTKTGIIRIRITPGDGTDTGLPDTTLNFGIDNQRPPIVPECTAAAVVGVADSGVYIFWAHAQLDSDVRGYHVYRSATGDSLSSTKVTTSLLTDTRGYKDMSVVQGDTRFYYVVSVDTYDNQSDSSELEGAQNLDISKIVSDSSNAKVTRPGDTLIYRITLRNNGFAPVDSVVLYDYVPDNTALTDSATATSVGSSWAIHYRVSGASNAEIWQIPMVDTATMVRYTRANRMDPGLASAADTLTLKIKVK